MPYLNVVLYSAEVNWFCDNTVILRVVLKREREWGGGSGGREGERERGSGREGEWGEGGRKY